MALISCPECGKKVSDMCVSCPGCGYPIAKNNPKGTVKVKILDDLPGTVRILDASDGQVLWKGFAGQIAEFYVKEEITIVLDWGLSKYKPGKGMGDLPHATVKGGDRYSLSEATGGFWGQHKGFVLNKVDIL